MKKLQGCETELRLYCNVILNSKRGVTVWGVVAAVGEGRTVRVARAIRQGLEFEYGTLEDRRYREPQSSLLMCEV